MQFKRFARRWLVAAIVGGAIAGLLWWLLGVIDNALGTGAGRTP